jgi:hypothetical protein
VPESPISQILAGLDAASEEISNLTQKLYQFEGRIEDLTEQKRVAELQSSKEREAWKQIDSHYQRQLPDAKVEAEVIAKSDSRREVERA